MKLLSTTIAVLAIATTSFAAEIDASVDVEVTENKTTNKYEAKTTVNLDIATDNELAFGGISLQSVDNASVGIDEWHVGTTVSSATLSFGDHGGVMPEATAAAGFDTLADTNATMEESLQVSIGGADFALGMTDIRTDVSDINNVQASYTLDTEVASITGAVDWNRTSEEYTYGFKANDIDLGVADLGGTASYSLSKWAYEVDGTIRGITGYLNGDEDDSLQHIGISHTTDVNGLELTSEVDYDIDNEDVSPSIKLSFNF